MTRGDRVKRVRRGCRPCYGTVLEATDLASEPSEQWLKIAWDNSGVSHAMRSEVKLVKIDRSHRATYGC